jgi:hypothetical protein
VDCSDLFGLVHDQSEIHHRAFRASSRSFADIGSFNREASRLAPHAAPPIRAGQDFANFSRRAGASR